jgi:hypothetical protein
MTRTSIYVRVDFDRHRRLTTYARENGMTVNDTCVMLIDQLLAQVSPGFPWPEWLTESVSAGYLQHLREYAEDDVLPSEPCATRTRVLRVV